MSSWFEDLFGFREQTGTAASYALTKEQFSLKGSCLTSKGNGNKFEAGRFETPSLGELKESVDIDEARAEMKGTFRVQEVVADVSALHTERANQFSMFQAASQFNCLEFVAETVVPEAGITCYASDKTQGPACATACAPGTVVRNYFGTDGKGQTMNNQIENLKECEELLENARHNYFKVVGGYTLSTDEQLGRLSVALRDEGVKDKFRNALRIGVQWDTQVTGSQFGQSQYKGPQHLVTQAYCSACSVAYSGGSQDNWKPFASLVLEASYEATMYAGLRNALNHKGEKGSRRIFLSAVGGGVFGNDMEWIVDAMERAFEQFHGLDLEVTIVSFGRKTAAVQRLLGEFEGIPDECPPCALL